MKMILSIFLGLFVVTGHAFADDHPNPEHDAAAANERAARDASRELQTINRNESREADRREYEAEQRARAESEAAERARQQGRQ